MGQEVTLNNLTPADKVSAVDKMVDLVSLCSHVVSELLRLVLHVYACS